MWLVLKFHLIETYVCLNLKWPVEWESLDLNINIELSELISSFFLLLIFYQSASTVGACSVQIKGGEVLGEAQTVGNSK